MKGRRWGLSDVAGAEPAGGAPRGASRLVLERALDPECPGPRGMPESRHGPRGAVGAVSSRVSSRDQCRFLHDRYAVSGVADTGGQSPRRPVCLDWWADTGRQSPSLLIRAPSVCSGRPALLGLPSLTSACLLRQVSAQAAGCQLTQPCLVSAAWASPAFYAWRSAVLLEPSRERTCSASRAI
jgi:hypothetical protein